MSFIDAMVEETTKRDAPKMSNARLSELKASKLPHATAEQIGLRVSCTDPSQNAEADACIAQCDEYLATFAPLGACPNCGRLHGFSWGMCHGEGHCKCGYPARAIHDLGEDIGKISNLVLFYHPDEIDLKAEGTVSK